MTERLVRTLQEDNAKLKDKLAARENELSEAKEQLASLNRGAGGGDCTAHASESAVLEGTAPSSERLDEPCVLCLRGVWQHLSDC